MGWFKKIFSKNIECSDEIKNHLVYLFPSRKINLSHNLVVNEGFVCVVVAAGKPTDSLVSGKYILNISSIPETFKRLKLDKPKKNGKKPNKFKADLYFVNLAVFKDLEYCSDIKYRSKSKDFGKIKGFVEGKCNLTVSSPFALIDRLILQYSYIKNGVAIKEVLTIVGNNVVKILQKNNVKFESLINSPNEVYAVVNQNINSKTRGFGISVAEVSVDSLHLNKRNQQKVNDFISKQNAESAIVNAVDFSVFNEPQNSNAYQNVYVNNESEQNPTSAVDHDNKHVLESDVQAKTVVTPNLMEGINKRMDNINKSIAEQIQKGKYCIKCGAKIGEDFVYCPRCGASQS